MTATSDTIPAAGSDDELQRRRPIIRMILGAFVVGLVIAAVVAAALFGYDRLYEGRILPGVHIGSVDVGGLDRPAARVRLEEAFGTFSHGQVILAIGDTEATISYGEAGRAPAVDPMLDAALAAGRTNSPVQQAINEVLTALRGTTVEPMVAVDPTAVARQVALVAARTDEAPTSATVVSTNVGFETTPAQMGSRLDEPGAASAIVEALTRTDAPSEVSLSVTSLPVAPPVSDDAADRVRAQASAMARAVTIVHDGRSWNVGAQAVHDWIEFATIDGAYVPVVDEALVEKALRPLAGKIDRSPIDATFQLSSRGKVVAKAGRTGRTLDIPGTAAAVVAALTARTEGVANSDPSVAATVKEVQPAITTDFAATTAPRMKPISSWTTRYVSAAHNGFSANITIPARAIDGTVVAPGEWFSFWDTVGDVSLAKGYKLGGAIINGRSVEGKAIGGGICSTSTTIFNAALRAGFEMGDRRQHYYYITRYPLGLDATVFKSGGGAVQDMTWRNDTPYPVLIKAYARPGIVRFTLYSVPNGRHVSFSKPVVKNARPGTTIVRETTSLKPGERQQIEWPATGMDVWVTRTVTDKSGQIIHTDRYYSHYARMVGVILVGQPAS